MSIGAKNNHASIKLTKRESVQGGRARTVRCLEAPLVTIEYDFLGKIMRGHEDANLITKGVHSNRASFAQNYREPNWGVKSASEGIASRLVRSRLIRDHCKTRRAKQNTKRCFTEGGVEVCNNTLGINALHILSSFDALERWQRHHVSTHV